MSQTLGHSGHGYKPYSSSQPLSVARLLPDHDSVWLNPAAGVGMAVGCGHQVSASTFENGESACEPAWESPDTKSGEDG